MSGFKVKIENDRLSTVCSSFCQNPKFGDFTSSIIMQSSTRIQTKMPAARAARLLIFSSFNQ